MDVRATSLLLPDGVTASAAAGRLAALVAVAAQRAHSVDRTYWDTFDGRLHRAGRALAQTADRLVLMDAATHAEQASAEHRAAARRLLVGDLPPGALRERLAPIVAMRALTPLARVRSRLLPIDVLDDLGKIVVRLRVEEPAVVPRGDGKLALRPRLHVRGVRGFDDDFDRVLAILTSQAGLREAPRAVLDDAISALGGTVGGTPSKLRITLDPGQRADAAAVTILRRLLDVIEANTPGALADVDSEFLHDLRVAVRRSRALQRELRGVFAPEPLGFYRDGFRELQALTGATRDLDVQLLEFGDLAGGLGDGAGADVAPLRRLLERRLVAERGRMVAGLRSARTRALLAGWREFLDGLGDAPEDDRPDAARPIADVAAERIGTVYRRMVKMGRAIGDDSPHEALHDLRKKGKELRYLLEFFSSLYPPQVVRPMVATLKDLQDVLGRFQDREVQADLLRALGDEIAAMGGGAAALMAMGVLVERLAEQQAEARAQFAASFAQFAAKPQRRIVAETFG
ncbi:MAG TPA: CHAD domain-containing protein [Solirubrobacteraceae bacterium]|nr:CHAD domain-containing protein [Solirubrobacteraceae bacterium]